MCYVVTAVNWTWKAETPFCFFTQPTLALGSLTICDYACGHYWRPYCVGYVLASYLFSDHICLISSWGLVTMWSPRAQLWWFCSSTTITTVCGQLYCMVTIGFTNQLWSCEKHITTFKIRTRICFFYETNSHNHFCKREFLLVSERWWLRSTTLMTILVFCVHQSHLRIWLVTMWSRLSRRPNCGGFAATPASTPASKNPEEGRSGEGPRCQVTIW